MDSDRWQVLAEVAQNKRIANEVLHRDLLFSRCILEYRYFAAGELHCWYDIHPLIRGIERFKEAWEKLTNE